MQNDYLKDYFESPEAMRGIFTWLVAGYFKYRRFGLKMSANMQKVVKGLVLLAAVIFDVVSKRGGKLIAKN